MNTSIVRKAFATILCLGMTLTFCACGNEDKGPDYADNEAMSTIGKGLEKRFAIIDQDATTDSEALKQLKDGIQAEIDTDTPLKSRQFENSKLQEQVISYINVLDESLNVTKEYKYHSTEYNEQWSKAYDKRTQILKTFVDDYGLKLSGDNQDTLEELVANGASAAKENEAKETINNLVTKAKFEKTDKGYDWYEYRAVIENTSQITFTGVSVILNLYDKDGVKKEAYINVNTWAPGEKAEFMTTSDCNAEEIKPIVSYYDVDD